MTDIQSSTPTGSIPSGHRARGWWIAAGCVAVLGLLAAAVWAAVSFASLAQRPAQFARASVPGWVTVDGAEGARLVVYAEATDPANAQVTVTVRGPDGAAVPAQRYPSNLQYDVPNAPGVLGYAVATFYASTTGPYVVNGSAPTPHSALTLAVGDDLARAAVEAIVAPAVLAVGVLALAAVLAGTPWARSRRSSR